MYSHSCKNINKNKIINDWEMLGINGKVRSFQLISYSKDKEQENSDFGESTSIVFNEEGYITTVIPASNFEGF